MESLKSKPHKLLHWICRRIPLCRYQRGLPHLVFLYLIYTLTLTLSRFTKIKTKKRKRVDHGDGELMSAVKWGAQGALESDWLVVSCIFIVHCQKHASCFLMSCPVINKVVPTKTTQLLGPSWGLLSQTPQGLVRSWEGVRAPDSDAANWLCVVNSCHFSPLTHWQIAGKIRIQP